MVNGFHQMVNGFPLNGEQIPSNGEQIPLNGERILHSPCMIGTESITQFVDTICAWTDKGNLFQQF